mmetsp:Transcript_87879/g.243796  ORF Transcript_87879/g.243796 Transcript_87879/m.243796 type:complete len:216 (-) Transcript_87879:465-1112(-)
MPAQNSKVSTCTWKPSIPVPGMLAASIFPWNIPLFPKTLILPSASPTTRNLAPRCLNMASAVIWGALEDAPVGTATCLWSSVVTFISGGWRYWEALSPTVCLASPRLSPASQTRTRCSRTKPPASPVATSSRPCAAETASCVIGWWWPALNVASGSPDDARSCALPLAESASSSTRGGAGEAAAPDAAGGRGAGQGRRPTKCTASACGTSAFETR